MGFASHQALYNESVSNGKIWETHFMRTSIGQTFTAGRWYDFSFCTGMPRPNTYYNIYAAGGTLVGTPMFFGTDTGGIYAGPNLGISVSGQTLAINGSLQLTDSSRNFLNAGFQPGMLVNVTGFSNAGNNGIDTISSVSAETIVLTGTAGMVAETPIGIVTINSICPLLTNNTFAINGNLALTDSSGSFLAAGFAVGALVTIYGFKNAGNNANLTIASVTANTMTFTSTSGLVVEPAGSLVTINPFYCPDKYVSKEMIASISNNATNTVMFLCDYLMYYGAFDLGSTAYQPTTSPVPLPRHTSGYGVKMALVVTADMTANPNCYVQVTYTNSVGVSGRLTPPMPIAPASVTNQSAVPCGTGTPGSISDGPFMQLQQGDVGVRSIQGVQTFKLSQYGTLSSGSPGGGRAVIVLVYPLLRTHIRGGNVTPTEVDTLLDNPVLPLVYDNAYLNWFFFAGGGFGPNGTLFGSLEFIWGNS